MTLKKTFLLALIALVLPVLAFLAFSSHAHHHRDQPVVTMLTLAFWQHLIMPGELSQAHASLEDNCTACHTPRRGVEAKNCIVCHADNQSILQRQPSAFHADIGDCAACHLEHRGRTPRRAPMDHVALARIGFEKLQKAPRIPPVLDRKRASLIAWMKASEPPAPQLQREEALLNCATCHLTKDRHRGLFGNDCAQCHGTAKWTLPEFRHPSSASQSCAQCHQAPPSHYMMHFQMISMSVARMEKAEVSQCFLCHQTTSWNDIKGAGYYKHH